MNPDGYVNDKPYPVSHIDDVIPVKAAPTESVVETNSMNGINGH